MDHVDTYLYEMKEIRPVITKRVFDVSLSFMVLIILAPLFLLMSLVIRITSSGPAFFCHKRMGLDGKEFRMYKFRTMIFDADQLKCNFTEEEKNEFEATFKLKNDPRVTSFGNILRKTSLDELPQFINVLKGDMSIVGPRPITKEELSKYGKYASMLLSVNPGITGLWQISGRNNVSYESRVMLDIQYIQLAGFFMDLKIFLKTFKEVLLRLGAY